MNSEQLRLYRKEKELKEKYWVCWLVILKARQIWFTTYKLVDKLDKCLFVKNTNAKIVAHNQDKLKELFAKVKLAYDRIPTQIRSGDIIWEKPAPKYDNVNELYFPTTNSRIKIVLDTRSGTNTDLHISEMAFIRNAVDMLNATLPSSQNADITIETTANGMNEFYSFWKKHHNNDTRFKTHFVSRHLHEEYKLEPPEWRGTPIELEYMEQRLKLSKQQIYRYYRELDEAVDKRSVYQEYPTEPEDAFISTGDSVFDKQKILSLPELGFDYDTKYRNLKLYRKPEMNLIIWVDTALGWLDWDNSAIKVRDRDGLLYASFYWKMPPDDLVLIVDRLFELWYIGIVAIENNNTGIATINKAKEYVWERFMYRRKEVDKVTNKPSYQYGWNTNSKTRPLMISEYEEAIRKGFISEISEEQRTELLTFVYNEKNKPEADSTSHDDAIMADSICRQMRKEPTIV